MKRILLISAMLLPMLTCRAQWLKPDIKTAEYPVVEICDPSLDVAVKQAITAVCGGRDKDWLKSYFSTDSVPGLVYDIIVVLPDSIPESEIFTATVYMSPESQHLLGFAQYFANDASWPKEYNGVALIYHHGRVGVFFSGKTADRFCIPKGDEMCRYKYDANFLILGEFTKVSIKYDHGMWSLIPDSLEWY